MKFATSIAPGHIIQGRQIECINTWKQYGKIVSFNHPSEIELLKSQGYEDVEFIPTYATQEAIFSKSYPTINNIVNYCKQVDEPVMMVNSDCEIHMTEEDMAKIVDYSGKGFVFLHRFDYDAHRVHSSIYKNGIDAFVFTPAICSIFPQTMFCIGQTFFDIWYPYHAMQHDIPLYSIQKKGIIFHKTHPQQYNEQSWKFWGNYTAFLLGQHLAPQLVSQTIYRHIWPQTKEIE